MFDMMPFAKSVMSPFYDMDQMRRGFFGDDAVRAFQTDVKDNGSSYTLEAELPGFKKEDIHISLNGDQLTIEAQHTSENDEKDDKGNYLRRERYYGSYSRSFDISEIDAAGIRAAYENGVLKLELPKRTETTPTTRELEIQ